MILDLSQRELASARRPTSEICCMHNEICDKLVLLTRASAKQMILTLSSICDGVLNGFPRYSTHNFEGGLGLMISANSHHPSALTEVILKRRKESSALILTKIVTSIVAPKSLMLFPLRLRSTKRI